MKKQISLVTVVIFTAGMIWISGCKPDDTSVPVVTVTGSNPMPISLNATPPTDPGATAKDDKDGDITKSIKSNWSSTNPNVNLKGTYTIKYTVTNAAGTEGSATRTVNVINDAESWAGDYKGNETDINGSYTYVEKNVVTTSTTKNNKIFITRLGDFANNTVYMDIAGTSITLPQQTVTSVGKGTANCEIHDRQSEGTGSKTAQGFELTYNDSKVSPCTGTRTGVKATFIKQ